MVDYTFQMLNLKLLTAAWSDFLNRLRNFKTTDPQTHFFLCSDFTLKHINKASTVLTDFLM